MSAYDSVSLILESTATANSLPDPITVPQRTHWITNGGSALVTWTSVGATPFTDAAGVNVVSVSVGPGSSVRVQSDGTRWIVKPDPAMRRIFAGSGVTDGSGNVTFTFTPAFATVPDVTNAVQTGTADSTECRITALSTSSVTLSARRSPAVTILGISVLSASVPLVGGTVHVMACEAGQF